MGNLSCQYADTSKCGLQSVSKDPATGDFLGTYGLPAALGGNKTKRVLSGDRRRGLQAATPITNPVICMTAGSALLFENISPSNYPVYQKDSLLNTNPNFDFSQFLLLQSQLAA